ncbi:MAG: RDD family protein [Cyclobacteriaceae bacterium]
MQTISVRTSQNVVIQFPLASVGERILGQVIDWLILFIYTFAMIALFSNLGINTPWLVITSLFVPWLFFNFLLEVFMNGQTIGKLLLKTQVVKMNGSRATIGDFALRWVFSLVDIYLLSGAIAVICVAAGGKGQRLGDIVAETTVIKLVKQKRNHCKRNFYHRRRYLHSNI